MTPLTKDTINTLARLLEHKGRAEFEYNGFYYEIFESADSGYIVNVYSDDRKDGYGNCLDENIVDGGLCTGRARDAIEFML